MIRRLLARFGYVPADVPPARIVIELRSRDCGIVLLDASLESIEGLQRVYGPGQRPLTFCETHEGAFILWVVR